MSHLQLRASDGHELAAYLVKPEGTARGAVVVIQEVFGVNSHIRRVAEQYAAAGYLTIAPAMFDRQQRGVELGYDAAGIQTGIGYMMKADTAGAMADVTAAIDAVSHAGKVGMVGYCWGGRVTWLAGCHTNIAAGVAYYGGGIAQLLKETPRCPMMFTTARRTGTSRPATSRPSARPTRRASTTCTRPAMASTARSAPTSNPPARTSRSTARSSSSAST